MVQKTYKNQWFPLDVFLISGHMHMGAGASMGLMHYLSQHPAVRSYGMVTYHRRESYDVQAMEYIRAGKVNTLFIDPGNTRDELASFDAAPYVDNIRSEFPNVVVVIYTWQDCWEKFTKIHPRFLHYFYLHHIFHYDETHNEMSGHALDEILDRCQEWHKTRYEYDIALSFAGEDRQLAEDLAIRLKAKGARVFYDKDEQAALLGKNLYEHLYDVYCNRSRYCVLLSSKHYAQKMWTSHERRSAQERALKERGNEFILPIRIDEVKLPGLSDLTAYIRATEGTARIANLISQKLWVTSSKWPKGYIGSSLY